MKEGDIRRIMLCDAFILLNSYYSYAYFYF